MDRRNNYGTEEYKFNGNEAKHLNSAAKRVLFVKDKWRSEDDLIQKIEDSTLTLGDLKGELTKPERTGNQTYDVATDLILKITKDLMSEKLDAASLELQEKGKEDNSSEEILKREREKALEKDDNEELRKNFKTIKKRIKILRSNDRNEKGGGFTR